MEDSEYEILPLLLSHADIAISCQSTFLLDAVAAGKPVISILFDGNKKREYKDSVRRYLDYPHIKSLYSFGGIKVAYSYKQLLKLINDYLKNPKKDWQKRASIIEQELYKIDGNSSKRICNHLLKVLNN